MNLKDMPHVTVEQVHRFRIHALSLLAEKDIEISKIKGELEWSAKGNYNMSLALAERDHKIMIMTECLESLAKLGNGDSYGNSTGNAMAQTCLRIVAGL